MEVEVKVTQSCLTLCDPMEFSRPEYWSGSSFPSPGGLLNPGIEPRSPTLQADSFPAEPPGKSKNTGVGSLSLLQGIFPTQESNRGLLHFRQILYQLSHQGSQQALEPVWPKTITNTSELPSCTVLVPACKSIRSPISFSNPLKLSQLLFTICFLSKYACPPQSSAQC